MINLSVSLFHQIWYTFSWKTSVSIAETALASWGLRSLTPTRGFVPGPYLGQSPQFTWKLTFCARHECFPHFSNRGYLCYGGNCELIPNKWLCDPWVMGQVSNGTRGSWVKLRDPSSTLAVTSSNKRMQKQKRGTSLTFSGFPQIYRLELCRTLFTAVTARTTCI
jgi:hypothetical protein